MGDHEKVEGTLPAEDELPESDAADACAADGEPEDRPRRWRGAVRRTLAFVVVLCAGVALGAVIGSTLTATRALEGAAPTVVIDAEGNGARGVEASRGAGASGSRESTSVAQRTRNTTSVPDAHRTPPAGIRDREGGTPTPAEETAARSRSATLSAGSGGSPEDRAPVIPAGTSWAVLLDHNGAGAWTSGTFELTAAQFRVFYNFTDAASRPATGTLWLLREGETATAQNALFERAGAGLFVLGTPAGGPGEYRLEVSVETSFSVKVDQAQQ